MTLFRRAYDVRLKSSPPVENEARIIGWWMTPVASDATITIVMSQIVAIRYFFCPLDGTGVCGRRGM